MLKKLIFKTVVIVFVFALFVAPVGAAEVEDVESEIENRVEERAPIRYLSLEESIRIAVENSPAIAIAKIEHEQALADLRQARRDAISIHRLRLQEVPMAFTYDALLAQRVWPKTAEMLELLSYKYVEFITNLVKFQVENAYYSVLSAEGGLQNARDSLLRAQDQLRLVRVGVDAGVNAQVDVLGAEVLIAAQELMVVVAENSLRQVRMDFNILVGLPLDHELELTSRFDFTPVELSFDEIKEIARERNLTYIQLHKNYEIQREVLNVAEEFFPANVYTHQEARRNYNIAKLMLQNADKELDLMIRSAFLNMETAKKAFSLMEKSVEQAIENYRLTILRFEVGIATLMEVERASDELGNAMSELLSAIYDYNRAAAMLQHGLFGN